jgi:hypothetical protein
LPRIMLEKDNLDERNAEFRQVPLTQNLFLNSVPKCGTHLIRNIVRMFVPVEQHYKSEFIQIARFREHTGAFDPKTPRLSWGHLLFDDEPAIVLRDVRKILLVRDPYDWVLARARFYLSENFDGKVENIKDGAVTIEALLNMMIFGVYRKVPTLEETFRHNGAAWMGANTYLIRYEELVEAVKALGAPASDKYFAQLFDACGIALPDDWRERVKIGADRKQSSTARENLKPSPVKVPDELPEIQKQLVDYASPGLRKLLGYALR